MHTAGSDPVGALDESFVLAAPVKELSGTVRAQRAYRIASDHQQAAPWRASALESAAPRLRRRAHHLRDVGRGAFTVAVVLGLLGWMHLSGADRFVPDPVNRWVTGSPNVPAPADAAAAPLGHPAAAPAGDGGFAFLTEHGGRPVAFDPCRPVHYVTQYDEAPPGADQLVQTAIAQLSAATGLAFVADGPTDEAPASDRDAHQPARYGDRWAPVLLAWSSEAQVEELAGRTAGYATPVAFDPDGRGPRLLTGQVVIDAENQDPAVVLTTMLHELGHLVGLDHVEDPAELMHPRSALAEGFTPGALRGLHQLGRGPCFG